jgi:hypothetical protein
VFKVRDGEPGGWDASQEEAEAGGREREVGHAEEKEDIARQVIARPLARR